MDKGQSLLGDLTPKANLPRSQTLRLLTVEAGDPDARTWSWDSPGRTSVPSPLSLGAGIGVQLQ